MTQTQTILLLLMNMKSQFCVSYSIHNFVKKMYYHKVKLLVLIFIIKYTYFKTFLNTNLTAIIEICDSENALCLFYGKKQYLFDHLQFKNVKYLII